MRAAALPPLRPAAFFWAVVPPCEELLLEELDPDFLPPRLDERSLELMREFAERNRDDVRSSQFGKLGASSTPGA